jgi:hypothetical protein
MCSSSIGGVASGVHAVPRVVLRHHTTRPFATPPTEGASGKTLEFTVIVRSRVHRCVTFDTGWAPPGGRGLLSLVEREYGSDGSLMEVHLNPKT